MSDAERSISLSLQGGMARQLDTVHALKEVLFKLWGEGMSKQERDTISESMRQTLSTLVNSVTKHLADGDMDRLHKRIAITLKRLSRIAQKLRREDYPRASAFIAKNARLMVTFAKLALEGVIIPYTSNVIERLMGEIAKRCKTAGCTGSQKAWRTCSTSSSSDTPTQTSIKHSGKPIYIHTDIPSCSQHI